MRAVVLVGGEGTRLRPLTEKLPKPAVELVDRPFLSYVIEWLGGHGVEQVILACGFLPDRLHEVLGDGEPGGPALRYEVEPEPLGTGGAIGFAAAGIEETFLALNGDCLADLDLGELLACHRERRAVATVGLYGVSDPSAFGLVLHEDDGQVTEFLEKPGPGSPEAERAARLQAAEVNAGIYVLEPEVLDLIPPGRKVSMEREVFPRLVGQGLYGRRLDGYWQDIGTPERYLGATWDILEGRVRTRVPPRRDAVYLDPSASVGDGAQLGPRAVVGKQAQVAGEASVSGSVLLSGSRVGTGATVTDSILSPGAVVEDRAVVAGRVIGSDERIAA